MNDQRLTEFMESLCESTSGGRVKWQSEGPASFLLGLPSGSVRIRSVDGDGVFPYELTIFDQDGVSLESATTRTQRNPAGTTQPLKSSLNSALRNLYDAARDSALNIDGLIEGILQDIEKGATEGPAKSPPPPTARSADDDIPF